MARSYAPPRFKYTGYLPKKPLRCDMKFLTKGHDVELDNIPVKHLLFSTEGKACMM